MTKSNKTLLGETEIKAPPPGPPLLLIQLLYLMNLFFCTCMHVLIFGLLQLKHFFFDAGKTFLLKFLLFFVLILVFDPQLPTCTVYTVYIGLLILS